MTVEYEFFYNWDYARERNPSLMCFGLTGGYGSTRANMRAFVSAGLREDAEYCFWLLLKETEDEMRADCEADGESYDHFMLHWFDGIIEGEESLQEARPFVRKKRWRDRSGLWAVAGGAVFLLLAIVIAILSRNA